MKTQEYIRKNETDFIRSKAQLLESQDDPVKKVNLIKDIVKSIAVIPEVIAVNHLQRNAVPLWSGKNRFCTTGEQAEAAAVVP